MPFSLCLFTIVTVTMLEELGFMRPYVADAVHDAVHSRPYLCNVTLNVLVMRCTRYSINAHGFKPLLVCGLFAVCLQSAVGKTGSSKYFVFQLTSASPPRSSVCSLRPHLLLGTASYPAASSRCSREKLLDLASKQSLDMKIKIDRSFGRREGTSRYSGCYY